MSHVILPSIYPISQHSLGAWGVPRKAKSQYSHPLPHLLRLCLPGSVSVCPVTCLIGTLELPTPLIAAHQLYNYVADHASSYHMKPLRMARPGGPEHNEYALVSAWHR